MFVEKISGKPFKSGKKIAVVSGVVEREVMSGVLVGSKPGNILRKKIVKPFYTFSSEDEGYIVPVCQCQDAIGSVREKFVGTKLFENCIKIGAV